VVTIFATLGVLLGTWLVVKLAKWGVAAWKGWKGGWVIYGDGREGVWVRRGEGWGEWWRRVRGTQRVDEEVVADGEARGRRWYLFGGSGSAEGEEERPLLGAL
jgi:hypothetical protein